MGNCIRTEMWKAFHNKMMRSALLIGFILVIADLVQTAITVSDLGASYAHSPGGYDGCSLFVNWIGVNGVTVGAVVFYAVWPFLAAMPYGWSLYEDNRSHMTNNILTRVPYSQYLTAKMAAVFVSGGIAIALPVTTDLFASAMVCPACIPRVALPITGFCSGTAFLAKLYYTHPWLHAIIWCIIEFFWGGVAASLCIIVGHKVALVSVTVSQQNSSAEGFPLTELSLYTTDMLMNMDWDLLGVVNPILDGATGIRLQDGASCDILLPFDLYRYRFTSAEWNRLEQSNIWLQVTNYPTRKIVQVNIGEE